MTPPVPGPRMYAPLGAMQDQVIPAPRIVATYPVADIR
jgi:hypothetical protein